MVALRIAFVLLACLAILPVSEVARAEDKPGLFPAIFAKLGVANYGGDSSNGFDVTGSARSAYGATVIGLSGPMDQDGWRLQLSGSYSTYSYDTRQVYCPLSAEEKKRLVGANFSALCNSIAGNPPQGDERARLTRELAPYGLELSGDQLIAVTPHQASKYHFAVAPGYRTTFGVLIVKAYLGLAYDYQTIIPADATRSSLGSVWGAESRVETWLPLSDSTWLSADGSYFTGTGSYSAAAKFGYRPLSWLTFGPELATYGEKDDVSGRAGAFLRFDAIGIETTISGGLSGNYRDNAGAYGSANFYIKF